MRLVQRLLTAPLRSLLTLSCLGAAFAFCAAFVATESLTKASAVAFVIAVAPLIAVTPLAAVSLLVCVNLTGLVESVPFVATGSLVLGIVAIIYSALTDRLTLRWSPVYTFALVLLAANAISVVDARAPGLTITALKSDLRDLLTFVVIAVLLSSVRDFRRVLWAGALTAGALAAITVLHEFVLRDQGTLMGLSHLVGGGVDATAKRQTGPLLDPNFWARVLILSAPIALSLAASERRARLRVLALCVAVSIGAGIIVSESRGGMIGLGVAVIAWLVLAGRRYRFLLLAVPLAINLLLLSPIAGPRLETVLDPATGATAPTDYSIAERELIATVSTRLIEAHPVLGVGYGNFGLAAKADERRHGDDVGLTAAHNLYLQRAAEGGVIGLLAWFAFTGSAVFAFGRSWALNRRRRRSTGRRSLEEWMAIAGLAGLIGWSTASLFLHMAQFRALLVIIALAAALDIVARDARDGGESSDQPEPASRERKQPRVTPRQLITVLVAVAVTIGVVGVVAPPRTSHWEATTSLYIGPSSSANSNVQGYRYTVLSGNFVQQTFSSVLESDDFVRKVGAASGLTPAQIESASVDVSGASANGRLSIVVTAPDPRTASALAAGVAGVGARAMSALQTTYVVSVGTKRPHLDLVRDWDLGHINGIILVVDLVVVCALLVIRRSRRVRDTALAA
jgi:O-antigen ligase